MDDWVGGHTQHILSNLFVFYIEIGFNAAPPRENPARNMSWINGSRFQGSGQCGER